MPKISDAPKIAAVDLFCGIGGLTRGLKSSGIEVRAGFDIDPTCRYAYEANNRGASFFEADIRSLHADDIAPHFKGADVTVLVGCAPCQPFSSHTRKSNSNRANDCSLLGEFSRLIKECEPDVVSMENVRGLSKHDAFSEFLDVLTGLEYKYDYDVVSCAGFGVPQNRKRLVLLASKLGQISLPCPAESNTTVADFIQGLPPIGDGETCKDDPVHASLPLSEINKQRIKQSKPGGSWKDWDPDLVNECHRKAYYPAPYGRMRWDAMAPTITTQFCYYSTGRFGHPEQDRTISVREAALLQTFPADYKLFEDKRRLAIREIARHVGNAVPVKLAKALGLAIREYANA